MLTGPARLAIRVPKDGPLKALNDAFAEKSGKIAFFNYSDFLLVQESLVIWVLGL